jgi:hypothetical protein
MEIWKDVMGYEGEYQISNTGKVKSLISKKKKILSAGINTSGYYQIRLRGKSVLVHTLVGKHFVANRFNKPQINHLDSNKLNNNDWNLEWSTGVENIAHALKSGNIKRGIGHNPNAKLSLEDIIYIKQNYKYGNGYKLAQQFNITSANISSIVNNKTWQK